MLAKALIPDTNTHTMVCKQYQSFYKNIKSTTTYPANLPDLESARDPPGGTGPNGSNLAPGGTAPL